MSPLNVDKIIRLALIAMVFVHLPVVCVDGESVEGGTDVKLSVMVVVLVEAFPAENDAIQSVCIRLCLWAYQEQTRAYGDLSVQEDYWVL